jgi:hypothetical protein
MYDASIEGRVHWIGTPPEPGKPTRQTEAPLRPALRRSSKREIGDRKLSRRKSPEAAPGMGSRKARRTQAATRRRPDHRGGSERTGPLRSHSEDMSMGYRLFMDGNAWCAVGPHFECLATDPAGFGETKEQAVAALLADRSFQGRLKRMNGTPPSLAEFTIE